MQGLGAVCSSFDSPGCSNYNISLQPGNVGPTMPHFIIYIESVYIYIYNLKGRWIFFHVKFIGNLHN